MTGRSMTGRTVEVLDPGPLTTTQDLGRPGCMSLGVSPSGAADRTSLRLANRLVGNPESAACLEATFGGLRLRSHAHLAVAVTGATVSLRRNGTPVDLNSTVLLRPGDVLSLGTPTAGVRSYLGVRGGVEVPLTLGSGSTDQLSGLGPAPLAVGDILGIAPSTTPWPAADHAVVAAPSSGLLTVPISWGPRADWLDAAQREHLVATTWTVTPTSNRIGLRLDGTPLRLRQRGELLSEGLGRGALQVPPSGQPIVFLADHPVTGGYPVVAVVDSHAWDRAGQAVPGQQVRFVDRPRATAGRSRAAGGW